MDSRLEIIKEFFENFMRGDMDAEIKHSGERDDLDGIMVGLNMIREEIRARYLDEELFQEHLAQVSDILDLYGKGQFQHRLETTGLRGSLVTLNEGINQLGAQLSLERAELEKSHRQFQTIFDSAEFGIAILDEEGVFVKINTRYSEMLGYSEDELIGRTFLFVTHPDFRPVGIERTANIFDREIPNIRSEKKYITKSGKEIWVSLGVSMIEFDDVLKSFYRATFKFYGMCIGLAADV